MKRSIAQDGRTDHHPPVGKIIADRIVLCHPVVPEGDSVLAPAPAHLKLRLLNMLEQQAKNSVALLAIEANDVVSEGDIDE